MSDQKAKTKGDDLTVIKGIAENTQDQLNSLGVFTLEDLVNSPIEKIQQGLNRRAPSKDVEEWRVQAAEFAKIKKVRQKNEKTVPSSGYQGCQSLASFVVDFQARNNNNGVNSRQTVCQLAESETSVEKTWPSLDGEEPWKWMLTQLDEERKILDEEKTIEPLQVTPEKLASENRDSLEKTSKPIAELEITGLRAIQEEGQAGLQLIGRTGLIHNGSISSDKPVSFELSLKLNGSQAAQIEKKYQDFQADIYAHNLSTSAKTHMELTRFKQINKKDNELDFLAVFPKESFTAGSYRLECTAILEGIPPSHDYRRIPIMLVD